MKPMSRSSLLAILIGGGALFVAVCILDILLDFEIVYRLLGGGVGLPFRFLQIGFVGLGGDYFSLVKMTLDWAIWCLVFVGLFYAVRAVIRRLM